MIDYENLPLFGSPFDNIETYVYYEGPKLFALRSRLWPIYYIINTVDEDEDSLTAVAVRMTEDRWQATRSGLIDLRDAFTGAQEQHTDAIVWHFRDDRQTDVEINPVQSSDLPEAWLSRQGARLSMPTKTAQAFEPTKLLKTSEAHGRSLFALEVESTTSNITEFPAKPSGQLIIAMGSAFESLSREHVARRASTAKRGSTTRQSNAHREISPSLVGLQAASFVFVFAVESDSIVEPTPLVAETLESLAMMVDAAGNEDSEKLLDVLKGHSRKVRNRFRDILEPLNNVGSGLTLTAAVAHSHEVRRSSINAASVARAIKAIDEAEPTTTDLPIARGILMGMNVRTKRFELVDAASQESYSGYMTDEASAQANNLPVGNQSFVRATLKVETPFFADSDGAGETYTLTSIEAIEPSA